MNDFEPDEKEVNNGTDDSEKEVFDSESINSAADNEEHWPFLSTLQTNNKKDTLRHFPLLGGLGISL